MKRLLLIAAIVLPIVATANDHTLHVISTGDVHGSYFDDPYMPGGETRNSLMSVKDKVDYIRNQVGKDNVLLLDIGDCLQGDDAAYYYNYVATDVPHLYPRLASYVGYDAIVVGNHDIETGHPVYDRVRKQFDACHIPWLAANVIGANGKPYFGDYKVFKRAGLKVLVMGFSNANIPEWLDEKLWDGMRFESIAAVVQSRIDAAVAKEKPQVVIVAVHSGVGNGDGKQLESEGLDIYNGLKGVDLLICAHDHKPYLKNDKSFCLMDGGARCANVGHATISVTTKGKKVIEKSVDVETVKINKKNTARGMKEFFLPDFKAVKSFSRRPVGNLAMELRTRDAYSGMCDYVNLLHTVQLEASGAQISFAAPLTFDGTVPAGNVLFGNMFTVYPYENELYVLKLTGLELLKYLEFSYDSWIVTSEEHVLKIQNKPDTRTGAEKWSFIARPYNFDSCAGICYTVDVKKPCGSRVNVISMADGSSFDPDATYTVAMTSYRAKGGGGLLPRGVGLQNSAERIVGRYPDIRDLISDWLQKHPNVTPELVGNKSVIGEWKFVPEDVVTPLMQKDMELLF